MVKLKVYVYSLELPTVGFIDKEGAMHACARAQKTAFQGLERIAGLLGNRYLCDEDREILMLVENFCKNSGLKYEIVDLGTMSFLARSKLRVKGIRTPAICYGEKVICGNLNEEKLKELLKS